MGYKLNSSTIQFACRHFGTSTHVKDKDGLLFKLSEKGYGGEGERLYLNCNEAKKYLNGWWGVPYDYTSTANPHYYKEGGTPLPLTSYYSAATPPNRSTSLGAYYTNATKYITSGSEIYLKYDTYANSPAIMYKTSSSASWRFLKYGRDVFIDMCGGGGAGGNSGANAVTSGGGSGGGGGATVCLYINLERYGGTVYCKAGTGGTNTSTSADAAGGCGSPSYVQAGNYYVVAGGGGGGKGSYGYLHPQHYDTEFGRAKYVSDGGYAYEAISNGSTYTYYMTYADGTRSGQIGDLESNYSATTVPNRPNGFIIFNLQGMYTTRDYEGRLGGWKDGNYLLGPKLCGKSGGGEELITAILLGIPSNTSHASAGGSFSNETFDGAGITDDVLVKSDYRGSGTGVNGSVGAYGSQGGGGGACAMSNSYGVGGKGQYAPDLYNYYYYGWSGGSGVVAIW